MVIQFNHTILYAQDSEASATFLAEMLGLRTPARWGPFMVVKTDNGTNLDYMNIDGEITRQHYAFWSKTPTSTTSSEGYASGNCPTGPIPAKRRPARSIVTTAGAASISRIRTGISSKSSPAPMAAAAGIPERSGRARATWRFPRSSSWRRRAPSWCCRDRTADCRCQHSRRRATAC